MTWIVRCGSSKPVSASSEGDDAADRVVGRDTHRYAVTWYNLDSKPAHPATQLGQHFVTLITLDAVETSAVNRYDRALHVNQIILAQ